MPPYVPPARPAGRDRDPSLLAGLRGRVAALEGGALAGRAGAVPFGVAALDEHLPGGGLACAALHDILAADPGPATLFAAAIAARAAQGGGMVLWCLRGHALDAGSPCPAGLAALGLDPARLILVSARNDADALWAMEEGLRAGAPAAVIGEVAEAAPKATRRLALAAESGRSIALLLRPDEASPAPSAAATRWRIGSAPSHEHARFRAELFRCRGGVPGTWLMEWQDETHRLALAAAFHDRAAAANPARMAG